MAHVLVKICGIKTLEMAVHAASQGASFVGLVFCKNSPRYVDMKTAKTIVDALKKTSTIPVAVFTESNADEIMGIADAMGLNYIQLHGDVSRKALTGLPERFHIIYAVDPDQADIPTLRPDKDFLLFDSVKPGSGIALNWADVCLPENMRCFLAGGLNPDNVAEAISIVHPFAVDVSSGVESVRGEKDLNQISVFLRNVL